MVMVRTVNPDRKLTNQNTRFSACHIIIVDISYSAQGLDA